MRNLAILVVVAAGLLLGPVLAADRNAPHDTGPVHARIDNQVLDLLNDEIVLDSIDGPMVWESESFDTSQYNRIGLRFSAEMEQGFVTCQVCWKFSSDDEFRDGIPAVTLSQNSLPSPLPDPGVPSDDPSIRGRYFFGSAPATDFTEVRGLRAMVKCSLGIVWFDLGYIGDDPGQDDPDDPDPIDITASVTDVKVLLRRE